MGACSCFSSSSANHWQPKANVISATGDLHLFQTPVAVSEVLHCLSQISSSDSLSKNFFLSNSDHLSYDELIPTMSSDEELIADQIYFVFHNSKLNCSLSATDMAALAVKASLALRNSSNSNSKAKSPPNRRRVQNKISPLTASEQSSSGSDYYYNNATLKNGGLDIASKQLMVDGGLRRSNSMKNLQRYSTKRAKMAVRSFRLMLSTIHEGSEAYIL